MLPPKPPSEEQKRAEAIRTVMKRAGVDKFEAAFELDEAGGDVDRAVAAVSAPTDTLN